MKKNIHEEEFTREERKKSVIIMINERCKYKKKQKLEMITF